MGAETPRRMSATMTRSRPARSRGRISTSSPITTRGWRGWRRRPSSTGPSRSADWTGRRCDLVRMVPLMRRPPLSVQAVTVGGAVAVGVGFARGKYLRWGATDEELDGLLPGDELVSHADVTATRAVTVRARAADVWPWIAQLGQGRAGFYSYDFLENLIGCDIHSADRIVPEWQSVEIGAKVKLAPEVALTVALVEPERALVLRGGIPMGRL